MKIKIEKAPLELNKLVNDDCMKVFLSHFPGCVSVETFLRIYKREGSRLRRTKEVEAFLVCLIKIS